MRRLGGPSVTLVGIADPQMQAGGAAISAVTAKVGIAADTSPLETAPALGFSGAAALDAQGRFAGVVVMKAPVVAGPSSPPRAAVVPAERIRNFLEANYVASTSGAAGVEAAKASVTRVICVRKLRHSLQRHARDPGILRRRRIKTLRKAAVGERLQDLPGQARR